MGQKGTGPKFITRPVCTSPQLRNNSNTVYLSPVHIYLLHVLSTWHIGVTYQWALQTSGQGWAGSKAVHGMVGGAHSLCWRSLTAGAAT